MKMHKSRITTAILSLSVAFTALSADIWVSPTGSDAASGSKEAPVQSLTRALRKARELRRLNDPSAADGITIHLMKGTHSLYEPVFVRPEDSGTQQSPTVIQGEEGSSLSGGVKVEGWKKSGNMWVADAPRFNGRPLDFRQMWVNGAKATRARDVANFDDMNRILSNDTENQVIWVPAKAVKKILNAKYPEMVLHQMWCVSNLRIKDIKVQGDSAAVTFQNPESRIQFERPWPRPMVTDDGRNSAFYLTNAKELLDEPGEWYHDIDAQKIYYMPRTGENMATADVIVPAIETLVQVTGTIDNPVKNVEFKNVDFNHTTWMRPSEKGHVPLQAGMYLTDGYKLRPHMTRPDGNHNLDNQGWLGRPASAVTVQFADDIDFTGCTFEHLGSSGLDYVSSTQGGTVDGCTFTDIAGNGVVVGSFSPEAHETHKPYDPYDKRELCTYQTIKNSTVSDIGNEDWGCVGICAGYVSGILIENNEVSEVPYTGISLGWGWTQSVNSMRNNVVRGNRVHRYGRHMYDTAGIYTLGAQPKSLITDNVVYDIYSPSYTHDPNHWFYLYTDEGSSFITVKDNWTQGEKYLKNANGPGNVWENNGPHVDIVDRPDVEAISFENTDPNAATWIWYPGDYEIWLGNKMNCRRTERGALFPPFWKMDSHYVTVEFSKALDLPEDEEITIAAEGKYNVKLDGKLQFGMPKKLKIPAGKHNLNIKIWNQETPPALYVDGKTVKTGSDWKVTYEDKEWIDESGKASDTSATEYMAAGRWNFNSPSKRPSEFRLATTPQKAVSKKAAKNGTLYDFGKETFGYIVLESPKGSGNINVYYGESPEEALDTEYCETLDRFKLRDAAITDLALNTQASASPKYTASNSKAFRYVYVEADPTVILGDVSMLYEYLPEEYRASFKCNDQQLNDIWDVGAYTMHLTTREFFIDGIKRDRWVWSGDAIQSYLMNYYLFFDPETVKRTIWLLRGKDPVTAHTNTIMDYTFYWFLSILDYYMYTGDLAFVEQIYPRMQSMMEYVLGRTNADGMVEGMTGDWVFVDWADFPMSKQGALSFEQLLFCKSLETMKECADLLGKSKDSAKYDKLYKDLRGKLSMFWDDEKKALIHNIDNGVRGEQITKFPNMFALRLDYLDDRQRGEVIENVMLNDEVPGITTPYMRFYELESLCSMGYQEKVLKEMKDYWGGMLNEGATSFWEKYNPDESGTKHLAMYGRPYGKSLCHAWGASPVYLLGKYYLGVSPTKPGYEEFEVRPVLGGLEWMEGRVPMPDGDVDVYMDGKTIKVKATKDGGHLYFTSEKGKPTSTVGSIEHLGGKNYRVKLEADKETVINY